MLIDANREQGGFTILELLLMLIVLGLLAALIVPKVAGFSRAGNVTAANNEVQNIRTAAIGYRIDQDKWPSRTDDTVFKRYYTGDLRAVYLFDTDGSGVGIGLIDNAVTASVSVANPWPATISFDNVTQKWK